MATNVYTREFILGILSHCKSANVTEQAKISARTSIYELLKNGNIKLADTSLVTVSRGKGYKAFKRGIRKGICFCGFASLPQHQKEYSDCICPCELSFTLETIAARKKNGTYLQQFFKK